MTFCWVSCAVSAAKSTSSMRLLASDTFVMVLLWLLMVEERRFSTAPHWALSESTWLIITSRHLMAASALACDVMLIAKSLPSLPPVESMISFWVNHFFCVARDPNLCLQ